MNTALLVLVTLFPVCGIMYVLAAICNALVTEHPVLAYITALGGSIIVSWLAHLAIGMLKGVFL